MNACAWGENAMQFISFEKAYIRITILQVNVTLKPEKLKKKKEKKVILK